MRDAPPDILSPIDESAPVSGHVPAPDVIGLARRHTRARLVSGPWPRPTRLPTGRDDRASPSRTLDRETLAQHSMQSHAQPLVDDGPAGLPVVYAIPAGGFDIVVNGDHLLSWGIEPVELQDAAVRNLAEWAATRHGPTRSRATGG